MAQPQPSATGETYDSSGWSQDDPSTVPAGTPQPQGASPLAPQSPMSPGDQSDIGRMEAAKISAEQPYRDKLLKVLNDPNEATAHLDKVQDAPKPEDYKKYSLEFASAMAVMGAIGGRWTRHAGNAALNAFTGALTGWHQGNLEAYEQASKQWEENTKKTIENNNVELEKYHEIMSNKQANIDQMMAAMQLAGAESQNKIIMDFAGQKNYTAVFNAVDKMQQANQRLSSSLGTLTGVRQQQQQQVAGQVEYLNAHPDLIAQMKMPDYLKLKGAAEAMGLTLAEPPGGHFSGGTPRSAPAMALNKFIQDNPNATPEEITQFAGHYAQEIKADRDFGTGTQGNAIRSFSVALDHLSVADQLGKALQNGDKPALNQLKNLAKQQFGWDGPIDFNFAKKIVGDEITKSILGSGAGTGQDREDIQKAFSSANSPQQLAGVIQTAKRLMAGQLHGLKQQYQQTTGKDDFDTRLSPAARTELDNLDTSTGTTSGNDGWGDVKVH